jgi:membrane-associated phospholipid phosphatase
MPSPREVCFRVTIVVLLGALAAGLFTPIPATANTESLENVGDILQIVLPITALGTTFFVGNPEGGKWDREGSRQFLLSYGSTFATTYLMKQVTQKRRPNGEAKTSHPSGHTSAAWAGAAFIGSRYGGVWGWLAYGGAILTGVSRVATDWHFADDVVAGASIAQLWNWVFVTPHFTRQPPPGTPPRPPRWHFEYTSAPAFLISNQVASPSTGGTTFNLNSFEKTNDPTMTAGASMTYRLDSRNQLFALILPFEARDQGTFSEPVSFEDSVFPADTQINSSWRLYDLRLRWRNAVVQAPHWLIFLGAGLMFQDTVVGLETADASIQEAGEDFALLPYAHADVGWVFHHQWSVGVTGSGGSLGSDWMVDADGSLRFLLNPKWEFAIGYRYYARAVATDELSNEVEYQMPFLRIGHSW